MTGTNGLGQWRRRRIWAVGVCVWEWMGALIFATTLAPLTVNRPTSESATARPIVMTTATLATTQPLNRPTYLTLSVDDFRRRTDAMTTGSAATTTTATATPSADRATTWPMRPAPLVLPPMRPFQPTTASVRQAPPISTADRGPLPPLPTPAGLFLSVPQDHVQLPPPATPPHPRELFHADMVNYAPENFRVFSPAGFTENYPTDPPVRLFFKFSVEVTNEAALNELKDSKQQALYREEMLKILPTYSAAELLTMAGKFKLKRDILRLTNAMLTQGGARAVYFEEFYFRKD